MTLAQQIKQKKSRLRAKQASFAALQDEIEGMGNTAELSQEDGPKFDDLADQMEKLKPEIDTLCGAIVRLEGDKEEEEDDPDSEEEDDDPESEEEDDDTASNRRREFAASLSLSNPVGTAGGNRRPHVRVKGPSTEQVGEAFAIAVQAMGQAKGDQHRAKGMVRKTYGNDLAYNFLNTGTTATGGALIPPTYVPQLIDLLFADVFIRRLAKNVPLINNEWVQPRKVKSTEVAETAEGEELPYSELELGELKITGRERGAVTAFTKQMLRRSNPAIRKIIQDDIRTKLADDEEATLMRGDQTDRRTAGLDSLVHADNSFVPVIAGAIPTIQEINLNLRKMITLVRKKKVKCRKAHWIIGIDMSAYLQELRNPNGDLVFPELKDKTKTLKGFPVLESHHVPETLGGGANNTEISFIDFEHILYGIGDDFGIEFSDQATINDGVNTLNLFQRNMAAIKTTYSHALGTEHPHAMSIMKDVNWHSLA